MKILLGLSVCGLFACSDVPDVAVLTCPCAAAWTCCPTDGVCVRDLAMCPTARSGDAGSPRLLGPGSDARSPTDATGATAAFSVAPTSVRLRLGAKQSFTATLPVTWSVEPASGGVIDATGAYRAPLRPGISHVRATRAGSPDVLVEVTVGPQTLSVLAGRPGGIGHADGFGSDVRFLAPRGIVGDDAFLYVNDTDSIRRIRIATGEVTTLAPDFRAGHLALGTYGLYASTAASSHQIKRIDRSTGTVTQVAGNALPMNPWVDWHDGTGSGAGFKDIQSLAADGQVLYVNDSGLLRRVDPVSGAVKTLAISPFWADKGPPTVSFPGVPVAPFGFQGGAIAVRAGQVYVVESAKPEPGVAGIWKYNPLAGSFAPALASSVLFGPASPALPAGGGAFASLGFDDEDFPLAVKGHAVVRSVILQGKVYDYPAVGSITDYGDTDGLGDKARLAYPMGLWSRGAGATDQYVADSANRQIRRVQMTVPGPTLGYQPWVVSSVAGASDHRGTQNGTGMEARLIQPHRLAVDAQGTVFVAEVATSGSFYVDQIRRIGANGTTSIVTALPKAFPYVLGMAVAQGTLFVTARLGEIVPKHAVLRFDAAAGKWTSVQCDPPSERWYSGLAYDGNKHLYAVDNKQGVVERFDLQAALTACSGGQPAALGTVVMTGLPAPAATGATSSPIFKGFRELAVDGAQGLLFVTDGSAIQQLDLASGVATVLAAPAGGWGPIEGLAYDPAGVLYVLPAGDGMKPIGSKPGGARQIRALVVPTGAIYPVVGTVGHTGVKLGGLPGGVNHPSAIALGPGGEVALVDEAEHVVLIAK